MFYHIAFNLKIDYMIFIVNINIYNYFVYNLFLNSRISDISPSGVCADIVFGCYQCPVIGFFRAFYYTMSRFGCSYYDKLVA